jgi:hypothetical protein
MLSIIKRVVSAAIVIAAVAAPMAAYARVPMDPISLPGPAVTVPAAPTASHAVATSSSQSFQWGDAGVGAGGLLVLICVGAGAAVVYRRRAHRPLAS